MSVRRRHLKTSIASYPLKLPVSVKEAAARLAKEDGVSLNQWIAVAIAQKIGLVETPSDFLKRWACKAKPTDMLPFLDRAKREAPSAGDEL
ncbi:toxin-antitoxin system HicB family antitoxin [Novosphingobium sp. CCH12-A3]|uniref:toxin-antitoxin system HicB family antitoxin n=1 Tax=Novosphingobium sp. CCH12-A3 TaxID=1768752 RepID=UPI000AE29BBA|nr:toxin-antitoxin system HicB family antitoxin [Novosphingobium sp. CCH12-A3]